MENNIYLYESQILEQKLNYFILESRYNEMILNESVGDKLKSAKKFISDRIKDLIKLFTSLKDRISKFFKEVVLKKVREIKSKLFKSKNKDNSTLKTIDIRLIISIIDGASQAYFDIMNNAPSELEYDSDKSPEELNKVITKFQQYKFPSLDDIKMKLKVPEDINKTQIKITKKEIEKIFKESEKRLIKEDLTDIDGYISGLKNIYNEVEKTNEATYSDEQMVSFIKWHKVLLSHETALCTILNSITSLRNQYVSKALSYFDKYLKNHNEVSDKDIEISNDFKEAVDNGKVLRVHIMLADSMIIDPTFRDLNTELKYASKMNGLFDEHDGEKFEEDSDKWDNDYLNTIMVELKGNFSRERLEHTKKVVRKLIPIKGDNNQKKTITNKDDLVSKEFKELVDKGNPLGIRSVLLDYLVFDICNNKEKHLDAAVKYAQSKVKLFDKDDGIPLEKDQKKWTKDYFNLLKVDTMDNFSKEKFEHAKQVCAKVYKK